jgi:RNase H-fold protein (predicted Holliday junction resolvase)
MSKKKEQTPPPPGGKVYNVNAKVAAFDHGRVDIGQMYEARGDIAIGGAADVKTIAEAFERITQAVNAMPDSAKKTTVQGAVAGLKEEADKGDKADESAVHQWFNTLAQWAPDAFEVAINTFINPISGLSTAFKKIAEYAKQQQAKKT